MSDEVKALPPGETKTEKVLVYKHELLELGNQNKELKKDMGDALTVYNAIMGLVENTGLSDLGNPTLNFAQKMGQATLLVTKLPQIIKQVEAVFGDGSELPAITKRLAEKYKTQLVKANG